MQLNLSKLLKEKQLGFQLERKLLLVFNISILACIFIFNDSALCLRNNHLKQDKLTKSNNPPDKATKLAISSDNNENNLDLLSEDPVTQKNTLKPNDKEFTESRATGRATLKEFDKEDKYQALDKVKEYSSTYVENALEKGREFIEKENIDNNSNNNNQKTTETKHQNRNKLNKTKINNNENDNDHTEENEENNSENDEEDAERPEKENIRPRLDSKELNKNKNPMTKQYKTKNTSTHSANKLSTGNDNNSESELNPSNGVVDNTGKSKKDSTLTTLSLDDNNHNQSNVVRTLNKSSRMESNSCKVSAISIPIGSDSPILTFKARTNNNDSLEFVSIKRVDDSKFKVNGDLIHSDRKTDTNWYFKSSEQVYRMQTMRDAFDLCRRIHTEYSITGELVFDHDNEEEDKKYKLKLLRVLPEGVTMRSKSVKSKSK